MNQAAERDLLAVGVMVGKRFRLEKLLGRGAMGSVWLATHTALSSSVAIKFLDRAKIADDDEVEMRLDRFRFEAQVSARISALTSRTVAVHDAGVFAAIPYLVMEYAPGRTLEDVLGEKGPLTLDEAARVADHIGEALGAAHAAGIIHRDVKLANILRVERDGVPVVYKLGDFGVARVAGETTLNDLTVPKKTAEGLIVGTPAYMSPEQIGAESEYGPPSDLWALGVVLYEAITGRLPFNSRSLTELAMAISNRAHEPPSKGMAHIGPALDAFFVTALAKRPVDRFSSAAVMSKAFADALARDTEPPPPPVHESNWPIRVGAALAAVIVVIGLIAWFGKSPATASSANATETPKSEQPSTGAPAATGDAIGTPITKLPDSPVVRETTSQPTRTASTTAKKRGEPSPTVTPAPPPTATLTQPPDPGPAKPPVDPSLKRPPVDPSMIQ